MASFGLQDPSSASRATFGPKDLSSTCKASPRIQAAPISTSLSTFDKRRLEGYCGVSYYIRAQKPNPYYIRAQKPNPLDF